MIPLAIFERHTGANTASQRAEEFIVIPLSETYNFCVYYEDGKLWMVPKVYPGDRLLLSMKQGDIELYLADITEMLHKPLELGYDNEFMQEVHKNAVDKGLNIVW